MAKLNIAVAGLGRIGWSQHCKALHQHRLFKLTAVCDPVADRCAEAEGAFGCASYSTFEKILKHPDLDAIVIATPTHLHKAHAIAAMKRGLHVILEKPMAMSVAESRAIIRASETYKRVLTVYQPHRVNATYVAMEKLLKRKDLGRPYQISLNWHRYVRRNDWQSMKKYGGGMLGNYGAHALDFLLSITGPDIVQCFSSLNRVASIGDAEDVVNVMYKTRSGMLAEVNVNQGSLATPPRTEIFFTKAYAWEELDKGFRVRRIKGKLPPKKLQTSLASANRQYPQDKIKTLEEMIAFTPEMKKDYYANFHKAVTGKAALIVPPEQTLEVMKLMEKIRRQQ